MCAVPFGIHPLVTSKCVQQPKTLGDPGLTQDFEHELGAATAAGAGLKGIARQVCGLSQELQKRVELLPRQHCIFQNLRRKPRIILRTVPWSEKAAKIFWPLIEFTVCNPGGNNLLAIKAVQLETCACKRTA